MTVRTVQRWTSNKGYQQAIEQLIAVADAAIAEGTSIEQQNAELLDYQDSQRFLALEMGLLASRLSQISKQVLDRMEQKPEEISFRLLPQLLRVIADLSEKASTCWARSTGIEARVHREVDREVNTILSRLKSQLPSGVYAAVLTAIRDKDNSHKSVVEETDFSEMTTDELLRIANGDLSPLSDRAA